MCKKIKVLASLILFFSSMVRAQTENSPYSRYGLGDQLPTQNILSRGMGGVASAYADVISVNFLNPASYSKLKRTTFDFGVELDSRTLRVTDPPPRKFSSASPIISYIQLGLPLSQSKDWGMNIGLRPVTRINYKIEVQEKLGGFDTTNTLFEGSGGTYEVYTGTGFSIKNLSLGVNVGYLFGTKDNSTKRSFLSDSMNLIYYPSQHNSRTSFGGLFGNAGLQYTVKVSKTNIVRFGANASLKRKFNADRDDIIRTYTETPTGTDSIDVIVNNAVSGEIVYPASYGFGMMYHKGDKWLLGADYSRTSWSDYRFFNTTDLVQDSWKVHLGGQVLPNITNAKSYWGRVSYRAGFNYGEDYVKIDEALPVWGVSLGLGLPMRPPSYSRQYSIINTTVEFGRRGDNSNDVKESYLRVAIGLTLSDFWFAKRRYE